jgi:cyclic-di-GMP-binding protein
VGNERSEELFSIPEQSKPTSSSFDARPKQVEAWIATLPMANTGESAKHIFAALREMNRLVIPEQDRYKALEILRGPVFQITEVLKKHYINQNLPLSPKNQKIAELAIQLNSEMAIGYKAVIHDKLSKTFSRLSNKTLGVCVHRAVRYLSNVLLCAYQIYIQHPESVWLQVHRLYLYAENNNLHSALVKDHLAPDAMLDSSIAHIYKQILLLALAGPYRLRQHVTEMVYKTLGTMAQTVRVHPYGEIQDDSYAFNINMNSDAAPGYFRDDGTVNPTFCRTVDTSELVQTMSNTMLAEIEGLGKIPADVQKRLVLTWSGRSHRTFPRTTKNNEIAITLGLSATHHYIDEIIRPLLKDPRATCPTATDALQSGEPIVSEEDHSEFTLDERAHYTSTPVFGISNLDDHTPDVWDPDFTYRVNNPASEPKLNSEQTADKSSLYAYTPLPCKGINESAGGYCLLGYLVYGKDSQKVQVGELVGIRDNLGASSTQLGIGIIRRIKNWKNGLELGIQKLAPCADAVALSKVPSDDSVEKYQRSLVLPQLAGIEQPATLITHAWHQVDDQLIANVRGHRTRIKLTKQLESTGVFSQFEFTLLETPEETRASSSAVADDEFDTVWNLI